MDEELLAEARRARERLIDAERDAEVACAEFHRAVHRLVVRGSSAADVAAALGLSNQELHEIVRAAAGAGRQSRGRTPDLDLSCSFCAKPHHAVRKLIAGPGAYICDACVELAEGVASSGRAAGTRLGQIRAVPEQHTQVPCTFCGKHRDQVTALVAMSAGSFDEPAGSAAICGQCLSLCNEIIEEELG